MNKGTCKIEALLEIPNEQFGKDGVFREFFSRTKKLGSQQLSQFRIVLNSQIAVEAILNIAQVGRLQVKQSFRTVTFTACFLHSGGFAGTGRSHRCEMS